jgi:carbamoyl-phosphate synthase small subunit
MKFGHHGANHPVQEIAGGRVMITSQNHGFAVDESSLPSVLKATHRSLFDGSLQGIARSDRPAFGFQGHPEASPGPHDLWPLFERFIFLMSRRPQLLRRIRAAAAAAAASSGGAVAG